MTRRGSLYEADDRGLIPMECNCGRHTEAVPVAWVGRYGWTCSTGCVPDRTPLRPGRPRKEPT